MEQAQQNGEKKQDGKKNNQKQQFPQRPQKFKRIEGLSEYSFRIYGDNWNDLFQSAILALTSSVKRGLRGLNDLEEIIELHGSTAEELLLNFLNEVIFLMNINRAVYPEVTILEAGNGYMKILIRGFKADYPMKINMATDSEMQIVQMEDGKLETNLLFN